MDLFDCLMCAAKIEIVRKMVFWSNVKLHMVMVVAFYEKKMGFDVMYRMTACVR